MFVVIWSSHDMARAWLDGVGAQNLDKHSALPTLDPTQLEAARIWVNEQYNGLSGGNGKAAVVQLLRAFTEAGYPLDADTWLRTYFAAGGKFRHATAIAKVIEEMRSGTRHRVEHRYSTNIVDVLRERATHRE